MKNQLRIPKKAIKGQATRLEGGYRNVSCYVISLLFFKWFFKIKFFFVNVKNYGA